MSWQPRSFGVWVVLFTIPGLLSAATLTVDSSGRGGYTTIQAAVDRAVAGDLIVLNPGTYSGSGNCDVDLRGKAITIQGTAPQDANTAAATIVDCRASTASPHRGFYVSGCTSAKIAGLTITNGLATAGGAIFCTNSVLELSNCRILTNGTLAGDGKVTLNGGCGGGLYAAASTLNITDCLITGNFTSDGASSQTSAPGNGGDGGGIYATGSGVHIDGCTISNNRTGAGGDGRTSGRGGDGGGLYCDSLELTDSYLSDNVTGNGGKCVNGSSAGGRGGNGAAVLCGRAIINHATIEGNTAGPGGNSSGAGTSTGGGGGGIWCTDSLQMTNCLIVGNRSGLGGTAANPGSMGFSGNGAGIWCSLGSIDHCTIVSNAIPSATHTLSDISKATLPVGGGVLCTSQTVIANSILWGNTPGQLDGQDCTKVSFSDLEKGTCATGRGNLSLDPAFVQTGKWVSAGNPAVGSVSGDPNAVWVTGDYRLSSQSPCIDTGDPNYTADANAVDLAGRPRIDDGRVDIGAYEYQSLVPIYHFEAPATTRHFYTASESEKNKLIAQSPSVWSYKGVAFYAYIRAVEPSLKPVYRFWSDKLGSHFWTISESEKSKLIAGGVWTYEGVAFYAFPEGQQPSTSKPVYRFWSATIGEHYYTIDAAEKDRLIAQASGTWTYEGPVWYAYDTPSAQEEKPPVTAKSYSFTAGNDAAVYEMDIKAVVDGQPARLDKSTILFTPALGHILMDVDFDAMTTNLTLLFLESAFLQQNATATQSSGTAAASYDFTLSVYGFFNTTTAHGPYAIDPNKLTFSQNQTVAQPSTGEDFVIAGSISVGGQKSDVNLTLEATSLTLQGTALLDKTNYPSNLKMTMAGPFQWHRQGHDDLLADVTVRGHRIQVYVTSLVVQTTGVWTGKLADAAANNSK
jgi:hypothetical protein